MTESEPYVLHPIGFVRSTLIDRRHAPRQGNEGAPDAWLVLTPEFNDAIEGITSGSEILIFTWLHLADRSITKTHPRNDPANPLTGVFLTRSPDRPNPIGLHRVTVLQLDPQHGLKVGPLEALDGTPIIDIKPVLHVSSAE